MAGTLGRNLEKKVRSSLTVSRLDQVAGSSAHSGAMASVPRAAPGFEQEQWLLPDLSPPRGSFPPAAWLGKSPQSPACRHEGCGDPATLPGQVIAGGAAAHQAG